MTLTSVNVNGRSYTPSTSATISSTQASNDSGLSIGLIVGLVGGTLILIGIIFGYHLYQQMVPVSRVGMIERDGNRHITASQDDVSLSELYPQLVVSDTQNAESSLPALTLSNANLMYSNAFDINNTQKLVIIPEMELISFD